MTDLVERLDRYQHRLEEGICEYMDSSVTERSAAAVKGMVECLEIIKAFRKTCSCPSGALTEEDIQAWNAKMINDDGTTGGRWPVDQTTAIAEKLGVHWDHITPACFNVAMNMMFSDYCKVADHFGVCTTEFFAELAKAFLFDKDAGSPKEKLTAYYHGIVNP